MLKKKHVRLIGADDRVSPLLLFPQYTNFELGVRVPLIVRAPGYEKSVGKVTGTVT